jgi:hypothetical protein
MRGGRMPGGRMQAAWRDKGHTCQLPGATLHAVGGGEAGRQLSAAVPQLSQQHCALALDESKRPPIAGGRSRGSHGSVAHPSRRSSPRACTAQSATHTWAVENLAWEGVLRVLRNVVVRHDDYVLRLQAPATQDLVGVENIRLVTVVAPARRPGCQQRPVDSDTGVVAVFKVRL